MQENASASTSRRILVRFLSLLALSLTASAGIIIFIVLPYELMERWHLLPDWQVLNFIYLLAAIVLVWAHVGGSITIAVIVCEVAAVLLQPGSRRAKIEAGLAIGLCTLTYLWLYIAARYNIH
jgi:hypothetical protein